MQQTEDLRNNEWALGVRVTLGGDVFRHTIADDWTAFVDITAITALQLFRWSLNCNYLSLELIVAAIPRQLYESAARCFCFPFAASRQRPG